KFSHLIDASHGGCSVTYRDTTWNPVFAQDPQSSYRVQLGAGGNNWLHKGSDAVAKIGQKVIAKNVDGKKSLEVIGSVGDPGQFREDRLKRLAAPANSPGREARAFPNNSNPDLCRKLCRKMARSTKFATKFVGQVAVTQILVDRSIEFLDGLFAQQKPFSEEL